MKTKRNILIITILLALSSVAVAVGYTPYNSSAFTNLEAPAYSMHSTSSMMAVNSSMSVGTIYEVGATSPSSGPRKAKRDADPDPEDSGNEPGTPTSLNQQLPIGDGMWLLMALGMGYAVWRGMRKRLVRE